MSLEDKLKGERVVVETQLYGGAGKENTQLYFGTYRCFGSLNEETVLVLDNATHDTKDDIMWSNREDAYKHTIFGKVTMIPSRFIISISVEDPERVKAYNK